MKAVRAPSLLVVFPLSLVLAGCSYFGGMSRHLKDHGISAEATIVRIWDTGWTVNEDPVIGLQVEVRPKDRPAFQARIERLLVSPITIPQLQPGKVIPVRFDPDNPAHIAFDSGTGNPYHDQFIADSLDESRLKPSAGEPQFYLGTGSVDDDYVALLENGYAFLGIAIVERGGADLSLAVKQAKEIGASTVVVYGENFDTASTLADLPVRRKSKSNSSALRLLERLPPIDPSSRVATFWGRHEPWVFGLLGRDHETGGIVAELIPVGSPADIAGIAEGDVIVAIDGKIVRNSEDLSDSFIAWLAGKEVMVDLLRNGAPMTLPVRMNPRTEH